MRKTYPILSLLLLLVSESYAGSTISGVSVVQVNYKTKYPNLVAITPKVSAKNRPSCATDPKGRFSVSLDTEAGKAINSMAPTAQVSGQILEIYGTDTCAVGGSEEIDFIRIK